MSYIINKIKDNIRKYGLLKFFQRACIKISHIIKSKFTNIVNKEKYKRELQEILEKNKGKKVVVFYPFFDFNMPNFQRFQQIAMAMAKKEDILFFYCTPNNIHDSVYGFKYLKDNLYITNQYFLLTNTDIENRVMFFVSTDMKSTLQDILDAKKRKDTVIYDYVDEIHPDIIGKISDELYKKHEYVLEDESIILLATAQILYDDVIKHRKKNVYLVTNGVNVEDFQMSEEEKNNFKNSKTFEIKKLKDSTQTIICYYGAFAKWFDYELIKKVAQDKKIGILLIGVDYDMSLKNSNLDKYENILYLGAVKYDELKYYADYADILVIPFVVNEITNATSPVKLFEYMALQKPIITTDLEECKKYKSVNAAKNYDDFIEKIHKLSNSDYHNIKLEELNEANENSWSKKADQIIDTLKEVNL